MKNWLKEITLTGKHVQLQPMRREHRNALLAAASDGELWKLWFTSVPSQDNIDGYLDNALNDQALGLALPFVVKDLASQTIIGMSRFCHATPAHRRVEIGYTWYAKRFQRSHVNSECKLLMLSHAFEKLSAIAVEFRTHWHNHASRTAVARLGAKQDGVLRNHSIDDDGVYRDTVVFSITENEWAAVKKGLVFGLSQ